MSDPEGPEPTLAPLVRGAGRDPEPVERRRAGTATGATPSPEEVLHPC